MKLLYSGDRGIAKGCMMSALSAARLCEQPLTVYLLTAEAEYREKRFTPIGYDFAERLEGALRRYNSESRVRLIDMTEAFLAGLPLANMASRFTPFCMLRLYADLSPEITGRVLYLDGDVICLKSPESLYSEPMGEYEIMGIPDRYGSWLFEGGIFKRSYLNSGVLLMDMEKIRESGLFERAREMCRNKEMFMPDQTALNKLSKKGFLPRRYNEQWRERDDTVLRHFTTTLHLLPYPHSQTVKPWDKEKMHKILNNHRYDALLCECEKILEGEIKK